MYLAHHELESIVIIDKTITCVVHDKGTVGDGVPASYSPPLVAGLEHLQSVLTPLYTYSKITHSTIHH